MASYLSQLSKLNSAAFCCEIIFRNLQIQPKLNYLRQRTFDGTTLDEHGRHTCACPGAAGSTSRHKNLRDWLWRTLKTLAPNLHVHRDKPLLQDDATFTYLTSMYLLARRPTP